MKTRDHFLSILTSPKWWSETQAKLRELFEMDTDFKERMFSKQMAVLKGQAFNVVETLKSPDQGPLELTRRARVHVWVFYISIFLYNAANDEIYRMMKWRSQLLFRFEYLLQRLGADQHVMRKKK